MVSPFLVSGFPFLAKNTPDFVLVENFPNIASFDMMRHCISVNGSFFNTQRMLQKYVVHDFGYDLMKRLAQVHPA